MDHYRGPRWSAVCRIVGLTERDALVATATLITVPGTGHLERRHDCPKIAPERLQLPGPMPRLLSPGLPGGVEQFALDLVGPPRAPVAHERGYRAHEVLQGDDCIARCRRLGKPPGGRETLQPFERPVQDAG